MMIKGSQRINLYLQEITGREFGLKELYAAIQHNPALRSAVVEAAKGAKLPERVISETRL